jgi:hypothetical protein
MEKKRKAVTINEMDEESEIRRSWKIMNMMVFFR